jgi:hypothetical protein
MDGWGKIKKSAEYADVSGRTFRKWLKAGLRHTRLPSGTILLKFSWVDQFLQQFEVTEDNSEDLVNKILREIT